MKNITEDKIEEIVNKAFVKHTSEIANQFPNTLSEMLDQMKDEPEVMKQAAYYYSSIIVAQNNCIATIKEALKELLCD